MGYPLYREGWDIIGWGILDSPIGVEDTRGWVFGTPLYGENECMSKRDISRSERYSFNIDGFGPFSLGYISSKISFWVLLGVQMGKRAKVMRLEIDCPKHGHFLSSSSRAGTRVPVRRGIGGGV